ncbi:MAG TPA: membrane protein insertase YidC [Cyanobacteria bacterium UBA8156]|jgi:YidC/Oxa1 family membrane protein insertase|nr:membrane protein insertase YidC [Cyanobacteria bacterium UBA8156]
MDFGIGFLSGNIMLPFLDWVYSLVPSYGLGIVALTLLVRLLLFPVSANQLRSMRRMKIANPIMQQRQREIQAKYKDDPAKLREEVSKLYQEFGNPLSGCLPALLQMPILFALFATLRGSPFADINYNLTFQVHPAAEAAQVQHQPFASPPQNLYLADRVHYPVRATVDRGTELVVGDSAHLDLQTNTGKTLAEVEQDHPEANLSPRWEVTEGADLVEFSVDGTLQAIAPGKVVVKGTVPGLAADKGFLFVQALGKVGVTNPDGSINWDIALMIVGFGLSLYLNQNISGSAPKAPNSSPEASQQELTNKLTPVIFSGMFLFFPLPAGVLMYMLIANMFQTAQAFLVAQEPLPENLQKIVDGWQATPALQTATTAPVKTVVAEKKVDKTEKVKRSPETLPFEPGKKKKD